jgi:hypothetical protein
VRDRGEQIGERGRIIIFGKFFLTSVRGAGRVDFTPVVELTAMTDPKLEEQIAVLTECAENLRRFHEIFDKAVSTETVAPEDEGKMQQLRNRLPSQWDALLQKLGLRQDDSVATMVEMASSLPAIVVMTDYQKRKLYDLWHKAYMKLQFLRGKLEYRKEQLEELHSGKVKAKRLLTSPVIVIILGLIALLVYIVLRYASAWD